MEVLATRVLGTFLRYFSAGDVCCRGMGQVEKGRQVGIRSGPAARLWRWWRHDEALKMAAARGSGRQWRDGGGLIRAV